MTRKAVPVCLKAVEIYSNSQGRHPKEVATLRADLEGLYRVLGKNEKAAEQNRLWQSVLKNGEMEVGNMLIHFGRCKEAIEVMSVVTSRDDTGTEGRTTSFVNMARASCILGELSDAKEHISAAEKIIEENGIKGPIFVCTRLLDICGLYEKTGELEKAISLVKRVFENSQHLLEKLMRKGVACS